MTTMQSGLATISCIRQALQAAGDALAAAQLSALEANEAIISAAASDLAELARSQPPAREREAYREELLRARAALERCLRLGSALNEYVRVTLVAQGRAGGYDRDGREGVACRAGALHVRG